MVLCLCSDDGEGKEPAFVNAMPGLSEAGSGGGAGHAAGFPLKSQEDIDRWLSHHQESLLRLVGRLEMLVGLPPDSHVQFHPHSHGGSPLSRGPSSVGAHSPTTPRQGSPGYHSTIPMHAPASASSLGSPDTTIHSRPGSEVHFNSMRSPSLISLGQASRGFSSQNIGPHGVSFHVGGPAAAVSPDCFDNDVQDLDDIHNRPEQTQPPSKKTLRSMSDLFSTGEELKQRKTRIGGSSDALTRRKTLVQVLGAPNRRTGLKKHFLGYIHDLRKLDAQQLLRICVQSLPFQVISALMIMLNGIAIGVDVELQAVKGRSPQELKDMTRAVNIWYIVELLLRLLAYGKSFFQNEDWEWNLFDLLLGTTSIVELVLSGQDGASTSFLRVVRIIRICRCLRLVRWLRHMREFRKMIFSMVVSIQTLLWAMVLLFFLLYFFGIWFTSVCVQHLQNHPNLDGGDLDFYFGSLTKSMYALWLSISGGMNWYYIIDPLFKVDGWLVALFIAYIATMMLGVTNIVTSVFVESAMRSTQHYRDLMLQEKARTKEVLAKHLRQIFRQMDKDDSGMISLDEMRAFLNDESLELASYFEALEVNAEDAKALFKLLDKDDSGEIDIEEFCDGCMRLKGEARSFDINCLLYKVQRMDKRLIDIGEGLDAAMELLADVLSGIASISVGPRGMPMQGFGFFQGGNMFDSAGDHPQSRPPADSSFSLASAALPSPPEEAKGADRHSANVTAVGSIGSIGPTVSSKRSGKKRGVLATSSAGAGLFMDDTPIPDIKEKCERIRRLSFVGATPVMMGERDWETKRNSGRLSMTQVQVPTPVPRGPTVLSTVV